MTLETLTQLLAGAMAIQILWQMGRVALALLFRLWFWLHVWWGGLYRVQVAERMRYFLE